jgi:hypothetical protein
VARKNGFPGEEVEHGGNVFYRPVPTGLALHSGEQAVESIHDGGRQPLGLVGQDPSDCHSIIRATRAIGSSNSPLC